VSGWYIWCGESLSDLRISLSHNMLGTSVSGSRMSGAFLGLSPGYRFLLAGDYLDVWYDQRLLDV